MAGDRGLPAAADRAALAENRDLAELLRQGAELLERQGANPFRVRAYRRGAERLEQLARPAREILAVEGREGLIDLPDIGPGLAAAVDQILRHGRWAMLDRLRGAATPEQLFRSLPGIGPELARRIHDELDVDTLEALEVAAHDGRLAAVPGIGPRRAAGIRAALESRLGRRVRGLPLPRENQPGVDVLLDVDREYRRRAAAGDLPAIAPRRFNPEGRTWLSILHTDRDGWHFTALFSNTARAHRLARTGDWVVLYLYDAHHREDQVTVVTERQGPLAGRRVVRGRETECAAYYAGRRRAGRRSPGASRPAGDVAGPSEPDRERRAQ